MSSYRYMRLLVMFDLPTNTVNDIRHYANFRKFLLKDGFFMLQYSIYVKICTNKDSADLQVKRITKNNPPQGAIRTLILTEKQYESMNIIIGSKNKYDDKIGDKKFIIFD